MLEEAGCDLLWAPSVEDIYPDGFATIGQRRRRHRALGRRGPAGPFRRRRDGGRQAADRGPAGRGAVRREGLSAARRDPAHGRGSRTCRSRSSAFRRSASRTASPCRRATSILSAEERQQALALPRALETRARRDPKRSCRSRRHFIEARALAARRRLLADRLFRAGRCGHARSRSTSRTATCA